MSSGNANANASASGNTSENATTTTSQGTTTSSASKARDRDFRKYKISTLEANGSNWAAWKHRVTHALSVNGLQKIVDSSKPRPAAGDAALADWVTRNTEGMAQIEFTIQDDPLVRLIDKVFHTKFTDAEPLESQMNDMLADICQ